MLLSDIGWKMGGQTGASIEGCEIRRWDLHELADLWRNCNAT
jgi:hypothetical protein